MVRYSTEYMNIRVWVRAFLLSRIARALAVGAVAVTVQTIIFEIIGIIFQLVSPSTAVVIGAEAGILTNFYLNNRFSFHDRQHDISLLSRLLRFHLVVSVSVLFEWLLLFIVERQTDSILLIQATYVAGIIIGFAWNYTCYLLFVWKSRE